MNKDNIVQLQISILNAFCTKLSDITVNWSKAIMQIRINSLTSKLRFRPRLQFMIGRNLPDENSNALTETMLTSINTILLLKTELNTKPNFMLDLNDKLQVLNLI